MLISVGRLGAARREAGNSMIKYQQIVYPLCVEIQVLIRVKNVKHCR